MDFTEFFVIAQRADLNRQLGDAELGAAVNDVRRRGRDEARKLRGQRLATGFAKLGEAFNRYRSLGVVHGHGRGRRSHYVASVADRRRGVANPPCVD